MRLILVRHGLTVENRERIIAGQSIGGILSAVGEMQVSMLARRLHEEEFSAIYSGNLLRQLATMFPIRREREHIPVYIRPQLNERSFGDLEGSPKEGGDYPTDVPGYESNDSLMNRGGDFLSEIMERHPQGTVLVVGSSHINTALTARLEGVTWQKCRNYRGSSSNASVTVFDPAPTLVLYNCVEHLEGLESHF